MGANQFRPWQPQTSSKTPPPWAPDMQWYYPLRRYAKDLLLWSAQTDLNARQQGPAMILQLGGGARALADEIQVTDAIDGVNADWGDGRGLTHHSGLHVVLRQLAGRYGELEIESVLRTLIDFMSFRRIPHEDIDQALTRFDILYSRAESNASVQVSPAVLSFILLVNMGIQPHRWPIIFMKWGGAFPTTDTQYSQLKGALREQGHLLENHPNSLHHMGRHPGATYHTSTDTNTDTGIFGPLPSLSFAFPAMADDGGTSETYPWLFGGIGENPATMSLNFPVLDAGAELQCSPCEHCTAAAYPIMQAGFDSDTDNDELYDEADPACDTYLAQKTEAEAGEGLYQAYLVAKRRWRKFSGRPSRATRFGQRHGRSKGKGKGGFRFLCQPCACWEDTQEQSTFFKGRGCKGGGKGKGFGNSFNNNKGNMSTSPFGAGRGRKNPIGKDGQIMRCSGCNSEEHLVRHCPSRSGQGKGGTGIMYADTNAFGGFTDRDSSATTGAPITAPSSSSEAWQFYVGMEDSSPVHLDLEMPSQYMYKYTLKHDTVEFTPGRQQHDLEPVQDEHDHRGQLDVAERLLNDLLETNMVDDRRQHHHEQGYSGIATPGSNPAGQRFGAPAGPEVTRDDNDWTAVNAPASRNPSHNPFNHFGSSVWTAGIAPHTDLDDQTRDDLQAKIDSELDMIFTVTDTAECLLGCSGMGPMGHNTIIDATRKQSQQQQQHKHQQHEQQPADAAAPVAAAAELKTLSGTSCHGGSTRHWAPGDDVAQSDPATFAPTTATTTLAPPEAKPSEEDPWSRARAGGNSTNKSHLPSQGEADADPWKHYAPIVTGTRTSISVQATKPWPSRARNEDIDVAAMTSALQMCGAATKLQTPTAVPRGDAGSVMRTAVDAPQPPATHLARTAAIDHRPPPTCLTPHPPAATPLWLSDIISRQSDSAIACDGGVACQSEDHMSHVRPEVDEQLPELAAGTDADNVAAIAPTEDDTADDHDDGDTICLPWWPDTLDIPATPTVAASTSSSTNGNGCGTQNAYHVAARLADQREGLLVDTGAFDNLTGSAWVARIAAVAHRHGRRIQTTRMQEAMRVRGVGKSAQEVVEQIQAPGMLENGKDINFKTPVVPNSDIPALLGIKSLENLEAIVDCRRNHRKLYLGTDTTIQAASSTTTLQLYPAMSGHLMLPITNYDATHSLTRHLLRIPQPLHLLKTETPVKPPQDATDATPSKDVIESKPQYQ